MKKQFQILIIAGTIIFFSCGRHNAEITGAISTGKKELSTNNSLLSNEADLLLIDTEGRLRFNAEPGDQAKKLVYGPVSNTPYAIDKSSMAKTSIRLNESLDVN